jgi:hypothetical protein
MIEDFILLIKNRNFGFESDMNVPVRSVQSSVEYSLLHRASLEILAKEDFGKVFGIESTDSPSLPDRN